MSAQSEPLAITDFSPRATSGVGPARGAVPGRARFCVPGLKHSAHLKQVLETRLIGGADITQVSANARTGMVLVHFPSTCEPAQIVRRIEAVLRDFPSPPITTLRSGPADVVFVEFRPRFSTLLKDAQQWLRGLQTILEKSSPNRRPTSQMKAEVSATPWHLMSVDAIYANLGSSPNGLSRSDAQLRLRQWGGNHLTEARRRSGLAVFFSQLNNVPAYLLVVSAGLSITTGGLADALMILSVVLANAYIGYGTETLAEVTLSLLAKMGPENTSVIREGKVQVVPTVSVVAGDLLKLTPGMPVPADARLARQSALTMDESALTGESMPVAKSIDTIAQNGGVPLSHRTNMVYRGTATTGGSGLAVVVATGDGTEIGRIQSLVAETRRTETPLQRQIDRMSRQLVGLTCLASGGVFIAGMLRGYRAFEMLKTAISLAIAAVPEGLPTVATTTLAQAALKMRKRKVLIRHLGAVETLGASEVVCFDKTGTLTENCMSVVELTAGRARLHLGSRHFYLGAKPIVVTANPDLQQLLQVCVLCNEANLDRSGQILGSATEGALLEMARIGGVSIDEMRQRYPIERTEYRTEEHSYMVTYHRAPEGSIWVGLKGSPLEVLSLCDTYLKHGKLRPLSSSVRKAVEAENRNMAEDALRVLGFAYRDQGGEKGKRLDRFTWIGLVGITDPAREGMKELIEVFHRAGIQTTMITGDQTPTARAIGERLGLSNGLALNVVDSTSLDEASLETLARDASRAHVFSRVSPSDKLKVVQALQRSGKITAMVGDGINDAPALKAADIGVAMGKRGTEVAREVADAVLVDDNLRNLVSAIELGRTTYDDIKKAVHFLLSTNLSETLVVFGSVVSGIGQPLSPLQLLWLNLMSDVFPALALALEAPEEDVLERCPRDPAQPLVHRDDYRRIGVESLMMTAGTMISYGYGIARYGEGPQSRTLAFVNLTTAQLLHTLSSRSEKLTLFHAQKLKPNKYIPISLAIGFGLQAASLLIPSLRRSLGLARLKAGDFLLSDGIALFNFITNEGIRYLRSNTANQRR